MIDELAFINHDHSTEEQSLLIMVRQYNRPTRQSDPMIVVLKCLNYFNVYYNTDSPLLQRLSCNDVVTVTTLFGQMVLLNILMAR